MKFAYRFPLEPGPEQVWQAIQDPRTIIDCMPGVEEAEPDGNGGFAFALVTGIGPVRLRFRGRATVNVDPEARRVEAEVSMSDARSGNVHGRFIMDVQPPGDDGGQALLVMDSDVAIAGKLGEFAQPLLKRKADQVVQEFVGNLRARLG